MEKWISKALTDRKADQCAALMIIDLDNFKYVNDTFGHMLGDALLVEVADMIRSIFQENMSRRRTFRGNAVAQPCGAAHISGLAFSAKPGLNPAARLVARQSHPFANRG